MYENLLCLPYFQGMGKDDITAILDKVKLEFNNHEDGEVLCNNGSECTRFLIVTKGTTESVATAPDGSYSITEEHEAPYAIEPYSMFGYNTRYRRKYTAKGGCTTLSIEKNYFFSEFSKQSIFTINLINIVSRRAQKTDDSIWKLTPTTIEGRIIAFMAQRSETTHGHKRLNIKMERLAEILCETRLNISRALNNLQNQGLVTLNRKEIDIPQFKALLPFIK